MAGYGLVAIFSADMKSHSGPPSHLELKKEFLLDLEDSGYIFSSLCTLPLPFGNCTFISLGDK